MDKKVKQEKQSKSNVVGIIILMILCFTLGFIVGTLRTEIYKGEVNIPDRQSINNFCQENNYEHGWLDSSNCKANQVTCHKSIGNAEYYDCLYWNGIIRK